MTHLVFACLYNVHGRMLYSGDWLVGMSDTANFLGISIVGQSNKAGDGGIYVGSIMKGFVSIFLSTKL